MKTRGFPCQGKQVRVPCLLPDVGWEALYKALAVQMNGNHTLVVPGFTLP